MTDEKTLKDVLNDAMYDDEIWMSVQVDDTPYIKFQADITKILDFTSNDPDEMFDNEYGSETWVFPVIDIAGNEKRLEISSKRLKAALFQVQPLNQGRIAITKTGEAFETQYTVEKIDE